MKIGIVQSGDDVLEEVTKKLEEEVATLEIKTATAEDPIGAIGKARRLASQVDVIMMFVELEKGDEAMRTSFYSGLAQLEANVTNNIYREIYTNMEEPDVDETVENFIEKEF